MTSAKFPPLGHVPKNMHAWSIRKDRHGPPEQAMQLEVLPTWELDSHDVLVLVMAAGVNYNGVWASLGEPVSPLDGQKNVSRRRFGRLRRRCCPSARHFCALGSLSGIRSNAAELSASADGSALLRYAPRSHPRAMHHEPWKGYRAFLRLDFDARPVVHAAGLSRRQAIEHA